MRRILKHLERSCRHHFSLFLATVSVLTACFVVIGGLLLLHKNTQTLLTLWGDQLQIVVYLNESAEEQQKINLKEKFQQDSRVESTQLVSKKEALIEFQTQMASYAPDFLDDEKLLSFIPESFVLKLKSSLFSLENDKTSPSNILQTFSDEIQKHESVQSVSYGQEWIESYAGALKAVQKVGFWFALIVLLASAFIIANSVGVSLQQRKYEIEVLELVGASPRMIRLPFLFEGFILSIVCAGLSLVVMSLLFESLKKFLLTSPITSALGTHLYFFSPVQIASLLIGASFFGLTCTALALRKMNTGWSAAQNLESI